MGRAPVRMKPCFVQVGALSDALVLPTSARRMHAGGLLHHGQRFFGLPFVIVGFYTGRRKSAYTDTAGWVLKKLIPLREFRQDRIRP